MSVSVMNEAVDPLYDQPAVVDQEVADAVAAVHAGGGRPGELRAGLGDEESGGWNRQRCEASRVLCGAARIPGPGLQYCFDGYLEAIDVLGGKVSCSVLLTGDDGLDQWSVVFHQSRCCGQAVGEEIPDARHEIVILGQRGFEVVVVRALVDGAVHSTVEIHERGGVVIGSIPDLGQKLPEHLPVRRSGSFRRPVRGLRLEVLPDLGELAEIGDVQVRGKSPSSRMDGHQTFGLKSPKCLSHGSAAESEPAGDLLLVDGTTRRDLQRHEHVAKSDIRLLVQWRCVRL